MLRHTFTRTPVDVLSDVLVRIGGHRRFHQIKILRFRYAVLLGTDGFRRRDGEHDRRGNGKD